ncbi:hypothetical protein SK803_38800 [Lentzea sp. BCCO 10_0856]|uniref:WXG100 family type VII secretion target n=1 Tax=Lentzea miocenica TaxID=3095431 RepID=A0ABU4TDB0_9PSEU|nr:hypothetical protein [Lentzea sp. BCCO 10_0856]MDX8036180.1 hypothetical protein [Lentzea sp. BCCO 10_0856]
MAETPVWPAEHDAKIREVAAEMGDDLAVEMLDRLKDILGHAPRMEQYGDIWAPEVMDLLANSQEDFNASVAKINDVWQGPAADEFKAWGTKYYNSLADFKGVVEGMRKGLYECSRTITDVYKSAIDLVAMIASQLVKLTTGILGSIPNPFGVANAIGGVLGAFIEKGGQLIGDGLKRLQEFRSIMSEIDSKVASLADLVPTGHMVSETGNWEVRPAG